MGNVTLQKSETPDLQDKTSTFHHHDPRVNTGRAPATILRVSEHYDPRWKVSSHGASAFTS